MLRCCITIAVVAGLTSTPATVAASDPEPTLAQRDDGSYEVEVLSKTFHVADTYRSMKGPWSRTDFRLLPLDGNELLWIVGYRAVMVGADGETPMPQDFMCHSNLDWDPVEHQRVFGRRNLTTRLFTLSQGQLDIQFPAGFGIPIQSSEELNLTMQVLNLNHRPGESADVRHRVTLRFFRDRDLDEPMRPLFAKGVYGLKLLEGPDGYFGIDGEGDMGAHGPGCLPGENASNDTYDDGLGRSFTGHWVVPPGREENHTLVTNILNLPFDTTVHYVAVHVHPFAESIRLVDLTAGETIFEAKADQFLDRVGLSYVESYSSEEGLQLYRDHEYELVSVYDNTSGEPQDSMAVLNLYFLDRAFERPEGL